MARTPADSDLPEDEIWMGAVGELFPGEPEDVHARIAVAFEDAEYAREALATSPRARLYTFNRLLARADPPDRAVEYVAGRLRAILDVDLEDAQRVVIHGRSLSELLMAEAARDIRFGEHARAQHGRPRHVAKARGRGRRAHRRPVRDSSSSNDDSLPPRRARRPSPPRPNLGFPRRRPGAHRKGRA